MKIRKKIREKKKREGERGKKKLMKNENSPFTHLSYPHRPTRKDKERQFTIFLHIIKRLQINVPFTEVMEQMPTYAMLMKYLLTKNRRIQEDEIMELYVDAML